MSIELYSDRVRERDLDNFLVEELQASGPFREWFLAQLPSYFEAPADEVKVRKSPPRLDGRQTDVELGWFHDLGDLTACVLIESKITADFQPGQANAYRAETERYRATLGHRRACSILVAPAGRLANLVGYEAFDVAIPLESIAEILRRRIDFEVDLPDEVAARLRVRVGLIEALCGKRQGSGWTPITIDGKRDFAEHYAELAAVVVPALRVRASTDGPKALTRTFDGLDVPSGYPCSVALRHEFGTGSGYKYANLQFSGVANRIAMLRSRQDLLEPIGAEVVEAGKSLAVRLPTPALTPEGNRFVEQEERVRAGLEAIRTLSDWFHSHREALAVLIRPEGPESALASSSKVANAQVGRDLRSDLERAMRGLARESEQTYKYRPGYFLDLLDRYGAEGTVHRLLAGEPSKGFLKLWELGALHLSIEALVGREPWASSGMFDEVELRRARQRLKQAKYIER